MAELALAPAFDVSALNRQHTGSGTRAMLAAVLEQYRDRRIGLVSSFGAGSAVLLHLVASVDRNLPVLFIDTGKLFGSTHEFRDRVVERLGLADVRVIGPEPVALKKIDPAGALWIRDKQACCSVRKVQPFAEAIGEFDVWISGRKRYQGAERSKLDLFEADGPRLKINPLAFWTKGDLEVYRAAFGLPQHPLVDKGYRSIGCEPCTSPVAEGEDERAGRWRDSAKTECGIHDTFQDGAGI